jgi:3-oxoacyl-[acyl-carrier protein] reductase
MRLAGKVAVVTGGGSGIGRGIVMAMAREGADIAIPDIQVLNAEKVAGEVKGLGRKVLAMKTDVTSAADVKTMIDRTRETFGKIDILVNNAGITRDALSMRMSVEDWDAVINTNLRGAFNFVQAVQRAMIKQRSGRVINIASVIGLMGNAGQTNYAASKAGLIGFTKSLARELASRNITVNAIAPGFITTDMTADLSAEVKQNIQRNIPLGRTGTPEDVANAVAFLASSRASYITGFTLCVDGGLVM